MKKGFSLIEVMVVVLITALISAAAVPAYLSYMLRAKLSTARNYVDTYNHQISDYYADHGTFPSNANLNISTTMPDGVAQYLFPPYVASISVSPQVSAGTQCNYAIMTAYFSNYSGDYFANGSSKYVVFNNYFIDNNGTMLTLCSYYEYDPTTGQPTSNDLFQDCLQTNTPSTSASPILQAIDQC